MAWYRTGTVAVTLNSATVTGTGTSFSANARVGDGFLGPDGRWYEVTNIASATVISITPNYLGSTASGQTYAIAPLQGYNLESATKMRAIIDGWGTTLTLMGTASTTAQLRTNIGAAASGINSDITRLSSLSTAITVAQGGTGATTAATARTNLGLGTVATLPVTTTQVTGGTWDLPTTSVPRVAETLYAARQTFGLYNTTSVVVNIDAEPGGACGLYATGNTNGGTYPQGGFANVWIETQQTYSGSSRMQHAYSYAGSATSGTLLNPKSWLRISNQPGTAWGRWVEIYNQSNTVGTVSGTSSAPTGAIIERGSNANGEYVKYADGTMFCWGRTSTASIPISGAHMGGYASAVQTFTFPVAFVGTVPAVVANAYGLTAFGAIGTTSTTLTQGSVQLLAVTNQTTSAVRTFDWHAAGRWAA